jgi:hypothetical protein
MSGAIDCVGTSLQLFHLTRKLGDIDVAGKSKGSLGKTSRGVQTRSEDISNATAPAQDLQHYANA